MLYRCILSQWAKENSPNLRSVLEGEFIWEEVKKFNSQGYNIYILPNYPSEYERGTTVDGSLIDIFRFVFVDMDVKDGIHTKDDFVKVVNSFNPSEVVDSGRGIHAYWEVSDLDAMSYLRLQRRLCRVLNTDEAVSKIYQLMRMPGTLNVKDKENQVECKYISQTDRIYTCEELDKLLPKITLEDEQYCKQHYEKTYKIAEQVKVDTKLPLRFGKLLKDNSEVNDIWSGKTDDRSKADYRIGHIMFASGFTKDEALSVLVNTAKAIQRAPVHRINYAQSIVDKIWTYEIVNEKSNLSQSVEDILKKGETTGKGDRFACHPLLDNTKHGFRLGQVIGLVGGSGVGKTTMALNMFKWFTERNPDYHHFFCSLEQPAIEIANRWKTICQGNSSLHNKVHVVSNYDQEGNFRHLSLDDLREYIKQFQKDNGVKVGTCVIDHIGALKKQTKNGENQGLMDICHQMKAFAVETDTMVIMQSQAPRDKAGIGDIELNKDCAYGTVFFESYVDYLLCVWQPLKRVYTEGAPTTMAFKFAKIRHKKQSEDVTQEDVRYRVYFDPNTEEMRELTQNEEKSFDFFNNKATNLRKQNSRTDLVPYVSARSEDGIESNKNSSRTH